MRAGGIQIIWEGNLKKLRRLQGACLALAFLLIAAGPASAAAATVTESEMLIPEGPAAGGAPAAGAGGGAVSPAVSLWDFVRMLLVLALVVAAIWLVLRFLRRKAGRRVQENDLIRVLGSRTLGGTRSLHVVEVGRGMYLVGSSDGGVELVAEITDKESLDSLRLRAAEEQAGGRRTFQSVLSDIFKPAGGRSNLGDSLGFLRRQRDRLKKL